jgi:hypothetical protein
VRAGSPFVISSEGIDEEEDGSQLGYSVVGVDMSDNMSVCGRLEDMEVKEEPASEEDEYQDSRDLYDNDSDTSALTIDTEAVPSPAVAEEASQDRDEGEDAVPVATAKVVEVTPAERKAANPVGGQQSWGDKLFPYERRTVDTTVAVIQAWMDLGYLCPAGGCEHVPVGCRTKEGGVLCPQRWDIFVEHWDTTHMKEPLEFRCKVAGCKHPVSKSNKRFTEHTKNHLGGSSKAAKKIVDKVTKAFAKNVGEPIWWKDLKPRVQWDATHLTAKGLMRVKRPRLWQSLYWRRRP